MFAIIHVFTRIKRDEKVEKLKKCSKQKHGKKMNSWKTQSK